MTSPVSLADARLVQRLRQGEPAAFDELWAQWQRPIWSLCNAMADDRAQALSLLQDVHGALSLACRGFAPDVSLCCHVSSLVYRRLQQRLELAPLDGIDIDVPAHTGPPPRAQLAARLRAVPAELRVVYLLDVFFHCPAGTLSQLLQCSEVDVRHARAQVAFALVAEEGA
ncbi:MAG: hypothetical protein H6742_19480 [Alphaproteobacteria bacterium]|nr:hypothetical protein [Alphaproteobacteria bacterium]